MIDKGLIVSIQGYSLSTTQELADICINSGAVGIRTDKPIESDVPVIGLLKFKDKKYYITTSIKTAENCSLMSNYVAIDCRKGNKGLSEIIEYCCHFNIEVVADIENIKDVENILKMKEKPSFISTTFSFFKTGLPNIELIRHIKSITDIPIIAEGGYYDRVSIEKAFKNGAIIS